LKEKIEEYKVVRKMDHGQINKQKKTSTSALEHLVKKEEGHEKGGRTCSKIP
jgi:hypothetical protein